MKKKSAFTLIELLVVVAIIGILATISTVSLYNTRVKGRDVRRVADTKQIQTALELYFNDMGRYPTVSEFESGTIKSTSVLDGDRIYMLIVPSAPSPADGSCDNTSNAFTYTTDSMGTTYNISYCVGGPTGGLASGPKCAAPDGVISAACGETGSTLASRNAQRLADIQSIETAMQAMYSANGYYFTPGPLLYYDYYGDSWIDGAQRRGNCSTVTSEPANPVGGVYGPSIPCPASNNSDWCIKLGANVSDPNESSGTACNSGTVYMRNIPLNNYLPVGTWTTGLWPYHFYVYNDYNGSDDYFRISWRLEESSARASDHFVNGVATDCGSDETAPNSILCN